MTGQELNTLVGKNIKYYREKKGFTQKHLAKEVCVRSGRVEIILYRKNKMNIWFFCET
jgi:transcriptional regulator with XRE-family HTH domain